MRPGPGFHGSLANVDVSGDTSIDHISIDKSPRLHARAVLRRSPLADQNAQFTELSTAIKESQADRNLYQSLGATRAEVAGAGFAESGSALDILRSSAQQGAMTKAVLGEQGLITEAGYKEQAQSYRDMAGAADVAIRADKLAAEGAYWGAGIAAASAVFDVASLGAGGGGPDLSNTNPDSAAGQSKYAASIFEMGQAT